MKKFSVTIILTAIVLSNSFAQLPALLTTAASLNNHASAVASDNWMQNAQNYIETSSYFFKNFTGGYLAANKKQQLTFHTNGSTLTVSPLQKTKCFSSSSVVLEKISKGSTNIATDKFVAFQQKDSYLKYDFNKYDVEYISNASGLRQNFIIKERPEGSNDLQLSLSVSGDLRPEFTKRSALLFYDKKHKKPVLQYDDLVVWDANHKKLDAFMRQGKAHELLITVDDRNAVYPVTVDPLTHSSEWEQSANGLLPTLLTNTQLQIDALYGYRTYGIGDINGDTFDDVAVSAPGAIDVISGSTLVNVGAVFIYFGGASGMHTAPDRILRPNTPVANALFGYSVSAGNVTGDGTRDIIIGAPGDSYTATVNGTPSSATIKAGKVYVFDGQDIMNNNLTAPVSLFLKGNLYFTNGVFGVGNNISINALFGYSVSVSDDIDGDGKSEIIVGSPGYAGISGLGVRTGAAFVYYSNGGVSGNTETRLNSPSLLNFPSGLGLLNLNGLLFGFSVDGVGDYNKDGHNDIVVGAPGGLSLSPTSFLGGSAYVFFGNGSTVSTNPGTQLTAGGSAGLLGSIANLFGYKVKGLSDANGVRNGNIIVGAPVGNILSNIVSGLRLQSGGLNVFTAKISPAASETPAQQIQSPRNGALMSILSGQAIDANVLTGAAIDNIQDANCDGYGDIIVGEPLSTKIGLVNADAVGGAAYVYTGRPDGTYNPTPLWSVENTVSPELGLNAASMVGYTVAGLGRTNGALNPVRVMVGAPGGVLDFSSGLLNLGNTLGTTTNFVSGDNGVGKSYVYTVSNCLVLSVAVSDFSAVGKNCTAVLSWKTSAVTDLSYTTVEMSTDALHFKAVQNVSNKNDNRYALTINQENQTIYYRLKFVHAGGEVVYSETKKVNVNCNKDVLQANPTLFSGEVKVNYTTAQNKGNAELSVSDIYGRQLIKRSLNITSGTNQSIINGASLAPGMYYVQVTGEGFRSEIVKIIKN